MAVFSDLELERIMNEAGIEDKRDKKMSNAITKAKQTAHDRVEVTKQNVKKNANDLWIKKKMDAERAKKSAVKEDGTMTFKFYKDENGNIFDGEIEGLEEETKDKKDSDKKKDDDESIVDKVSDLKDGIKDKVKERLDQEEDEWRTKPAEKTLSTAADMITGNAIFKGITKGAGFLGRQVDDHIINKLKEKRKEDEKAKKESADLIYRYPEFNRAMTECFDICDRDTRRILLAVNEADQSKVLVSLTSKLYESVINKIDDIDFGTIPASKGDITKLPNYEIMTKCLANIREILCEYKQDTHPVDVINESIANLIDSADIWTKAYSMNVELPMVLYNTMVLAVIEGTSFMVSMCVEFIKSPSEDTMKVMIDKSALNKSKQHVTFKNLEAFNDAYRKGQVTKAMSHIITENLGRKNFVGMTGLGIGATIVAIAGLLFCIIPIIRELIFLFYYYRVRVSEFFDVQADMLQISSFNVQNNRLDLTSTEKKNISTKQMKVAERFRKLAKKIEVSGKTAEHDAVMEAKRESSKKYKAEEVMDELPDSAASALF